MSADKMTCMGGCGRSLAYPDAFPDHIYAVCWKCKWDEHNRQAHRPSKRQRRKAAKAAARIAYRNEMAK